MSADAKIWKDGDCWRGCHDGARCELDESKDNGKEPVTHEFYNLTELLASIEICMGATLQWEFRSYPNNQIGLVGYV